MNGRRWGTLLFNIIGLGASGYLTYTHFANTELYCGGWSDCSYVQASSYALIMGIPVALIGFVAYLVMLGIAIATFWYLDEERSYTALQILFGLAAAGMLYSAYLTYIEAFVLHAYCLYCLTSAVSITMMTILLAVEVWRSPTDEV